MPKLTNSQEPEPVFLAPWSQGLFFWHLGAGAAREKKTGAGATWGKNQEPEPLEKSQEPKPIKELAGSPALVNITVK